MDEEGFEVQDKFVAEDFQFSSLDGADFSPKSNLRMEGNLMALECESSKEGILLLKEGIGLDP